jgi:hypothetical protein
VIEKERNRSPRWELFLGPLRRLLDCQVISFSFLSKLCNTNFAIAYRQCIIVEEYLIRVVSDFNNERLSH